MKKTAFRASAPPRDTILTALGHFTILLCALSAWILAWWWHRYTGNLGMMFLNSMTGSLVFAWLAHELVDALHAKNGGDL